MKLTLINKDFSVCKIQQQSEINLSKEFVFFAKTDEGLSLICESHDAPPSSITVISGWKAFKVEKGNDLETANVIAVISNALSETKKDVFWVTTPSNVYIFLKSSEIDECVALLKRMQCITRIQ